MQENMYTPVDEVQKIHERLRAGFQSGRSRSVEYRKRQLLQLARLLEENAKEFHQTLRMDLGRHEDESEFLEINLSLAEVKEAIDNVGKWAATEKARMTMLWFAMAPAVKKEPKGVVLIISPFNFPLLLSLGPLSGAIASGCAVMLKPSELITHTNLLLAKLWPKYLDPDLYQVVLGDVPVSKEIMTHKFDHILFTGSERVGRLIAMAAAENLTPVTLELGGKCPVIIDPKCDVKHVAKKLMWGKLVNTGQICVSPDYALVPKDFQDTFVSALQDAYAEMHPKDPRETAAVGKIVSEQHTLRLKRLIDETDGTVVLGGDADVPSRYIAPTIIKDVKAGDVTMKEEIFGPILPIVPVDDIDAAIAFVRDRQPPLSIYVFSNDKALKAKVFDNTQSGTVSYNELVIHYAVTGIPFGGIGASGSGYTTGKYTFDIFTHLRSSLETPKWTDQLLLFTRYPPYERGRLQILNKIVRPSFLYHTLAMNGALKRGLIGSAVVLALALSLAMVLL